MKDGYRTVGAVIGFTIGAAVLTCNVAAFLIGAPAQLFKRWRHD